MNDSALGSLESSTLCRLSLEITARCSLKCTHCYADSGPRGSHGTMSFEDWRRVIRQARDLEFSSISFIGGEPTMHPRFGELVEFTLDLGLPVRICSNLVKITEELWRILDKGPVTLQVSYYSDDPHEHDRITGIPGSHKRTTDNLRRALRAGIPVTAAVIHVLPEQRVAGALAQLAALGVERVHVDRLRRIGRGALHEASDETELCGRCATDTLAIQPDGTVTPCVLSRWLDLGDVRTSTLAALLTAPATLKARERIRTALTRTHASAQPCAGNQCSP